MEVEKKAMMMDKKTKEPYINVWFGNFYRPAYDDKQFVREGIALLKWLGFNSVLLDTKAWEDVRERCEGGDASPYVEMQEYMQQELKRQGMSHEFLALYLNGDNLYPNIRFSPPIYGESVVKEDGSDGKWYRYWSEKARTSMEEHIKRLWNCYQDGYVTIIQEGKERFPICSMWDPIVAPSFDEEGRIRYINWLKKEYKGDISKFNEAYQVSKTCFEELQKEDYWFSCKYPDSVTFSSMDVKNKSPKCRMLMDNKKWQCDELCLYFADMDQRIHQIDEKFYLCPDMAQWGYFLNVDGSMLSGVGFADLWDTAERGIDIYQLASYVDCANFISVPITPFGDADIYVTSAQHAMLRNINRGREFIGGIYWGRFLYQDIYSIISPCETVASIVASGAAGYTSYGMCGLDDGGVLHRMDSYFNESLRKANQWAKEVIPQLGEKKKAEIAILFPSAMAAYETMRTDGNKERRMDLLGWYRACCDVGLTVDIVDYEQLLDEEVFQQYKVLILPEDDCYAMNRQIRFEQALCKWNENGGAVIYGVNCALAELCFHIKAEQHEKDAFFYQEAGMVQSREYCSYIGGTTIAYYLSDQMPCVSQFQYGKGNQYAFGFQYGYAYTAKIAPHVPIEQKNNELYPITMMKRNIIKDILEKVFLVELKEQKNIEIADFANGTIIINHTSYPYEVDKVGKKLYQYPVNDTLLLPHSAVFIGINTK